MSTAPALLTAVRDDLAADLPGARRGCRGRAVGLPGRPSRGEHHLRSKHIVLTPACVQDLRLSPRPERHIEARPAVTIGAYWDARSGTGLLPLIRVLNRRSGRLDSLGIGEGVRLSVPRKVGLHGRLAGGESRHSVV
jgi:hypothetical protein